LPGGPKVAESLTSLIAMPLDAGSYRDEITMCKWFGEANIHPLIHDASSGAGEYGNPLWIVVELRRDVE
jgi:hypothetical protein